MKKRKITGIVTWILAVLVVVVGVFYLNTRPQIQENHIRIEKDSSVVDFCLNDLELTSVQGSLVNGKGESRTVEGYGVLLRSILAEAGMEQFAAVTVTADDAYSAELSAAEILETDLAFLLLSEESYPELVVFGDQNSKRNVKNVVCLTVK